MVSSECQAMIEDGAQGLTYEDIQAGGLEQSDLVSNAEPGEAR